MIKFTLTLSLFIMVEFSTAQSYFIKPRVDERTELLSTVFRLAGAVEYINNQLTEYTAEIDSCFSPFKDHPIIKQAKQLRFRYGISFDAVMSMAINLEISDQIRFKTNISDKSLEKRWKKESAENFLALLNQFYSESKFHEFYLRHSNLYLLAEKNFTSILNEVDFEWFKHFFGKDNSGNFNLVISLINGGSGYGPKIVYKDGKEELYAIIGTWQTDSLGQPKYSKNVIPLIIHEFNHSFCNPLIDSNYVQMEKMAERFHKENAEILRDQAYGKAKTMLYEILVRACVIKYYQREELTEANLRKLIFTDKARGFLWIGELVSSLDIYAKNRDKYKTLGDYMPEIIKLQNSLSPEKLQKNWEDSCVRIVGFNIENKSKNVDPNIKELIVTFDRPMFTGNYGSSYGKKGEVFMPDFPDDVKEKIKWDETSKMQYILPIILKPGKEYSISFPAQFFRSEGYYPLLKTYYLDFKTKK